MGRHRAPTNVLRLRGSLQHDRRRYADRLSEPAVTAPLGEPPALLSKEERAAWRELVKIAPHGVLTRADRWVVEIAARLMARERAGGLTGVERSQLISILARCGLTPSDRSHVTAPRPQEDNPFAKFYRGPGAA